MKSNFVFCLFGTQIPAFVNYLSNYLAHFSSGLSVFFLLAHRKSCIPDMGPFSVMCIENILSPCGLPIYSLSGVFFKEMFSE